MAYARVADRLWLELRPLGDDARLLALYVRTCSHRSRVGLFRLEPLYVAADLEWEKARVTEALEQLDGSAGVSWDPGARVVLVADVIVDDPPANGNVATAAIRELESVPDTPLFAALLTAGETARERAGAGGKKTEHFEPLLDAVAARAGVRRTTVPETVPPTVAEGLQERLREPSGNGSRNGRSPSLSLSKPVPIQPQAWAGRESSTLEEDQTRTWEELKAVVREKWHLGSDTIVAGGHEIGMGAERLNVYELVASYGREPVMGVVGMGPEVLEIEAPASLRLFTSERVGPSNWSAAEGQWRKAT